MFKNLLKKYSELTKYRIKYVLYSKQILFSNYFTCYKTIKELKIKKNDIIKIVFEEKDINSNLKKSLNENNIRNNENIISINKSRNIIINENTDSNNISTSNRNFMVTKTNKVQKETIMKIIINLMN